jgi:peptidoglycan/LPS O-acetylase OafA/YrhL
VWDLPQWRLAGNVLILGLMVAGAQLGYLLAWRRSPRSFWPAGLMAAGVLAVAAGANFSVRWQESLVSGIGAILWLTGMAMCVLAGRKHPTPQTGSSQATE